MPQLIDRADPCELDVHLEDSERQPCEVWTRVMGYHRPAASFNTGKKGEYEERQYFAEKSSCCGCCGD